MFADYFLCLSASCHSCFLEEIYFSTALETLEYMLPSEN